MFLNRTLFGFLGILSLLGGGSITLAGDHYTRATGGWVERQLIQLDEPELPPTEPVQTSYLQLEHDSIWLLGDNYFAAEALDFGSEDPTLKFQWHTRFGFGPLFGMPIERPIRQFGLAGGVLIPQGEHSTYLVGLGLDFKYGFFDLFRINVYRADRRAFAETSVLARMTWESVWFRRKILFTGTAEVWTSEGDEESGEYAPGWKAQPQLLWYISRGLGLGVEYLRAQNPEGMDKTILTSQGFVLRWTL